MERRSHLSVRAGELRASIAGPELHDLTVGAVTVAERMYVGVRDELWSSVPGELTAFDARAADDRFSVEFVSCHRGVAVDFEWRGTIEGRADGTVRFTMDGEARSEFTYSRIGISVHHALDWSRGRPFEARSAAGTTRGRLPEAVDGGIGLLALFPPYNGLTIRPHDGLDVDFAFEGELWEMQDHRNWGDANFKSYATPMSAGYTAVTRPGQRFRQAVTVSTRGVARPRPRRRRETIRIGGALGRRLPRLGARLPAGKDALTPREVARARALRLDHLRVDLELASAGWPAALARGADACRTLGLPAELAVRLPVDGRGLEALRGAASGLPLARLLVYPAHDEEPTPASLVLRARDHFPGAEVLGGTSLYFSLVNAAPPGRLDLEHGVAFPLSPQLHAAADRWVMANASCAGDAVVRAKELTRGAPVVVAPVSLVHDGGPFHAERPAPGLPPEVDLRQRTGFLAAWTVEAVRRLAAAGAEAVTLYDLLGPRGLFESDAGSPPAFASSPGEVFPVYDVLAALAGRSGSMLEVDTTAAPGASALAFATSRGACVLVANLTPEKRRLDVDGDELVLGPYAVLTR